MSKALAFGSIGWLAVSVSFVLLLQPGRAGSDPAVADATLGLPPLPVSDERAADRIALGRKLFMDPRLSRDDSVSCGTCHMPEQGFALNTAATAVGSTGRPLRRNAPTVLNVGYSRFLFHDGRASTLEEQAWVPLLAPDEMGNPSREAVAARIGRLPDYAGLLERAFPGRGVAPETIAEALAAYQRSLASGGSRFDRWFFRGETNALTEAERRGYAVFRRAQCAACHEIGAKHALFTDDAFHNLGVGLDPADRSTLQLTSGVETKVALGRRDRPFGKDEGRFEVTRAEQDRFAFRTPTLRNIELTAPYMHDGSLATLREVVDFYDRGGNPNPGLDKFMMPLFLSERDKADLVAFMRSLTGANVEQLATEARAAVSAPSFR